MDIRSSAPFFNKLPLFSDTFRILFIIKHNDDYNKVG